jgi:hypothetical protein
MKTYSRSILYVSIFALLALASCKKDDDPAPKSKTELLTANTWKFSSVTTSDADIQTFLTAFLTGSEITYKKDFTYTSTTLLSTDVTTGKWEFADNETAILLDKGTSDEDKQTILKLDGSNLELKFDDSSLSVEATVKFVKK